MRYIKADTHSPEYAWHKYWSRKPANVIRAYLQSLIPQGGLVVDPFSGSGVVIREATKLGYSTYAFDVNPAAVAISEFMISDISPEAFSQKARALLDCAEKELGSLYIHGGKTIRYLVHHVVVKCKECNHENIYSVELHRENGKRCSSCGEKLSFGIAAMERTHITSISYTDGSESFAPEDLNYEMVLSSTVGKMRKMFDMEMVDNRRTLTSRRISSKDYFTNRNFQILSRVAELAHEEADEKLRTALLLLVTGTSAQASRLIASRGKLAGGGQAWSIPGFWVPPIHLESNPFIHLRARLKKMHSALRAIQASPSSQGTGSVKQIAALEGLSDLRKEGKSADLVFLDPPYGDSVAFVEFSAIWNSFLLRPFNYEQDISVSDRVQDPMNMETYEMRLAEICKEVHEVLKPTGKVLLTFNNHDLQAWKSIVGSIHAANLRVIEVNYQDPAVISSKSQKAIEGSYVGDFYVVFAKDSKPLRNFQIDRNIFSEFLTQVADVRGGRIAKGVLYRFALQRWLERNYDSSQITLLEELIRELFVFEGSKLQLKTVNHSVQKIVPMVRQIASRNQLRDQEGLKKFANDLEISLFQFGVPTISEALSMVEQEQSLNQLW